jgi:sporulation protein YlmC with PRC-barrel domain
MRLSDILGTTVQTQDGRNLGRVREVRFIRQGPSPARLELDGLIVSRHSIGARLGLDEPDFHGLALLRAAHRFLSRDASWVPFEHVSALQEEIITVRDANAL